MPTLVVLLVGVVMLIQGRRGRDAGDGQCGAIGHLSDLSVTRASPACGTSYPAVASSGGRAKGDAAPDFPANQPPKPDRMGCCCSHVKPTHELGPEVPTLTSVKQISVSWLRKALAHHPWGADITSFEMQPVTASNMDGKAVEDGGGLSGSSIVRLLLSYSSHNDDSSRPEAVIYKFTNCKTTPPHPLPLRVGNWLSGNDVPAAFAREAEFYKDWQQRTDEWGTVTPRTFYCGLQDATYPCCCCMVCCDARPKIVVTCIQADLSQQWTTPVPFKDAGDAGARAMLSNVAKMHGQVQYSL